MEKMENKERFPFFHSKSCCGYDPFPDVSNPVNRGLSTKPEDPHSLV
jgi:hypothetical protein